MPGGRESEVQKFYKTKQWQRCRESYAKSQGYLCERCYSQGIINHGDIVHHIIHIDADTVSDPAVTLNPNNLELVCRKCHALEHPEMYGHDERRYFVFKGRVVPFENNDIPPLNAEK